MTKKDELTEEQLKKQILKYIEGRQYTINIIKKQMEKFTFKDFNGSYEEYLKERRRKFEYKIHDIEEDIKFAINSSKNSVVVGETIY